MATGPPNQMSTPHPAQHPSHRGAPAPVTPNPTATPPSRRDLASWWKQFLKNSKKEDTTVEEQPQGIFGVPLGVSIKYANVAISLTNEKGESFIYGYVPIVVAKCGVFLKEKATDIEGIFRLSGSAKRIKDLQTVFNSPDRYGKGLDWSGYTVHDAANILRRYLNQLPEPIVPLEFYERFRDPLRNHEAQAVGDMEAQAQSPEEFDHDKAVSRYQRLIIELPPLNRQLLLYILDLLAVFSSKSDLNRMTSANLAAIFQPGILSHPSHDMAPQEYRLSQDVLIFLIENQDNFLIGMTGTAADEKTVKEVQSGGLPPQQNSTKANIGRSASNASAGADSLRRFGSSRRQRSVSSRNSKNSGNTPSPVTPSSGVPYASNATGSGVHRSSTVPSKKSPALSSGRFSRHEPSTPTSGPSPPVSSNPVVSPQTSQPLGQAPQSAQLSPTPLQIPPASTAAPEDHVPLEVRPEEAGDTSHNAGQRIPQDKIQVSSTPANAGGQSASPTPIKERKISNLFSKAPASDAPESKESRQPKKLKKRQKLPGSANASAQSSVNSLTGGESPPTPAFHTPMVSPPIGTHARADPLASIPPTLSNTAATPVNEGPNQMAGVAPTHVGGVHGESPHQHHTSSGTLKPGKSPPTSIQSKSSFTDQSDFDQVEDPAARKERKEKRNRWRFSAPAKRNGDNGHSGSVPPPNMLGANSHATFSNSSLGSKGPRKSFTNDSQQLGTDASVSTGYPSVNPLVGQDSDLTKDSSALEPEKRGGFIGKIKAKMEQAKEARKEKEAEKERTKSPPRDGLDQHSSRHSLSAATHDHMPIRGRSMEVYREPYGQDVSTGTPMPMSAVPTTFDHQLAPQQILPQQMPTHAQQTAPSAGVEGAPEPIVPGGPTVGKGDQKE